MSDVMYHKPTVLVISLDVVWLLGIKAELIDFDLSTTNSLGMAISLLDIDEKDVLIIDSFEEDPSQAFSEFSAYSEELSGFDGIKILIAPKEKKIAKSFEKHGHWHFYRREGLRYGIGNLVESKNELQEFLKRKEARGFKKNPRNFKHYSS